MNDPMDTITDAETRLQREDIERRNQSDAAEVRKALEEIAVRMDEQADDVFADLANDEMADDAERAERDAQGHAFRRAAEIIRYQIECEA